MDNEINKINEDGSQDEDTMNMKLQLQELADKTLIRDDLSPEQKLFVISQIFKDELQRAFPSLNYALLAWKDERLKQLWSKEVVDLIEQAGSIRRNGRLTRDNEVTGHQ